MKSKTMAADPIAVAKIFCRVVNKFFDISVRLPLDDFTGNRMNVDRLLKKTTKSISGRLDLLQRLIQFQKIKWVS